MSDARKAGSETDRVRDATRAIGLDVPLAATMIAMKRAGVATIGIRRMTGS